MYWWVFYRNSNKWGFMRMEFDQLRPRLLVVTAQVHAERETPAPLKFTADPPPPLSFTSSVVSSLNVDSRAGATHFSFVNWNSEGEICGIFNSRTSTSLTDSRRIHIYYLITLTSSKAY